MARAPAAAAPIPADDAALPNAEMAQAEGIDTEAEQPVVVATILKNADGGFTLETGDEPEEVIEGAVEPMAPMGQNFTAD